ncbi:MAG: thiamine phosphate synthase [Tabrizicola sp.]|jgi:thiamine-phosphate pyrophosphorylase|nr:thiamine phosphate synthase [Tabrizicola sp.]
MAADDRPQITLITPPTFEPETFASRIGRVLDGTPIACLRLSLGTRDEDTLMRAADAAREVAHARDVAVVIDNHLILAERLGLDGVHLIDGSRNVRKARKDLGADAIVGAFCRASKHDGMTAGETGADYVAFGPVGATTLGDGSQAPFDLFEWWSEVIEVPVIAEGALTADLIARFGPVTDFFAVGEEIWGAEDPLAALKTLLAPLG